MTPNFLIIGAARCGTTWITENLRRHQEVFLPRQKELHFFDRHYASGIDFYSTFFDKRKEKALGEATPAYLYFEHIPALIRQHLPEVKLIVSLRHPAERAYSHYLNLQAKAPAGDPNAGLPFEESIVRTPRILRESAYYEMLRRYFELFPNKQILVLLYDELKRDPRGFLNKIYSFLEVDSACAPAPIKHEMNASAIKIGRNKLRYWAYRGLLRVNSPGLAGIFGTAGERKVPPLRPETRRRLTTEVFGKQIVQLEALIGKDLSQWKRQD